jgi:hypothetical protein
MLIAARFSRPIIGALAVVLTLGLVGCNALRLGYSNGPQLAWWWLDGYVDFSREQSPRARQAIDRWFGWHASTQLPAYAALLTQAQVQVLEPLTADAVCRWQSQGLQAVEPALRRAAEEFAELVPGLGPMQFKQLEQRQAKANETLREDYLQSQPLERQAASFKRTLERAESVYGELNEAQKRLLSRGLAASPFNPERWLQERMRRQRDLLQTLRKLVVDKAGPEERVAALRALARRSEESPEPAYRDYQKKLNDYNCSLVAQLHNTTTPTQRQHARSKLRGWEDDIRWLVANPFSGAHLPGPAGATP